MPRVIHFEHTVEDPDRAIAFYSNVFGWQVQKWEGKDIEYWLVMTGDENEPGIDGGLMRRQEGMPNVVNTIDVPSLDDYMAAVEANGGKVVTPRSTVPGVGYFAYALDTEGNMFGMMESDPNAGA